MSAEANAVDKPDRAGPRSRLFSDRGYVYLNVFFVCVLLVVYYLMGGGAFPDYPNYVTIVNNGGYLFSKDEYMAEWVSRFFLSQGLFFFDSAEHVVDFFALIVQVFYILFVFYFGVLKGGISRRGWFFFTAVLGPLLITTALRASPAYILIAYIAATGGRLNLKFLLLSVLAVSFHDSALILVVLYAASCLMARIFRVVGPKFYQILMWCSLVLILLSQQVALALFSVVSKLDMGIRSVYFQELPETSIVKKVFLIVIWIVAYTTIKNVAVHARTKIFVCGSMLLTALSFSLNEVAGIRFALYVLGSCVLAKGAFIFSGQHNSRYRQIDVVLAVAYFGLVFMDILRNARGA
ncbi:hypothetical protein NVB75_29095 [Pseudomonas sp. CBS]|uniref:hypothetical protein n=1 Tax=Pseudomonas TaxID=286 RepID=UPI0021ACB9B3|nr:MULTISPECIES: hypothetical protein [unclassified Pseudomonas]UVH50567.1 hypothetical protein NVB75_29095 [Pseudomonas sp. CBS]WEL76260.1 hypothetical protein P0D92_30710 [Pseudomonas sp. CBSPAW29]WEL85163.1 hypothetical protein P0D95_15110 [Pseudomonas sp. CBSPCAW29]WEL87958.1 hypothetical protein P0D90_30815 [Pseudomonas sp. CBSPCBW29]